MRNKICKPILEDMEVFMEQIIRAADREPVMRQQKTGEVEYLTFPLLSAQPDRAHTG